jgi:uncharacterized low-complexity protein
MLEKAWLLSRRIINLEVLFMTKKVQIKPVAAAVGVSFVTALAISTPASAADNPFAAADLDSGYLLAIGGDDEDEEGKCGEGKCNSDGDCKGEDGDCSGDDGDGDCSGDDGDCSGDDGDDG